MKKIVGRHRKDPIATVTIRIPIPLLTEIDARIVVDGISRSDLFRQAIRRYIDTTVAVIP